MPRREHLVLCGGAGTPEPAGARSLRLDLHGSSPNVKLRIQDISARLVSNIPDGLVDLLEVASYVYAADAAISRGGKVDAQMGARWRRSLRFVIPVRCPEIWQEPAVSSALTEVLGFLSDDLYRFEFSSLKQRPPVQPYFEFSGEEAHGFSPDEVVLFSGGLDSFGGVVEELAVRGKAVALVSHRSAAKIAPVQMNLVADLRKRFGRSRILHVPVWVNVVGELGRESTHRTRSFLFAALGAVTARLFGLDRIKLFENGIVSLNLPLAAQVVGARATRTTHPQVLAGFGGLLSTLFGRPIEAENPFAWRTKAEILEQISENGFGRLIRNTRSCTRVHDMTILHPHCGQCSQCIDRRFAVLAAGLDGEDPEEAYKVDLLTGARRAGSDRAMALAYVRFATEINRMTDVSFFRGLARPVALLAAIPSLRARSPNEFCSFIDGMPPPSAAWSTRLSRSIEAPCEKEPCRPLVSCLSSRREAQGRHMKRGVRQHLRRSALIKRTPRRSRLERSVWLSIQRRRRWCLAPGGL